ncbi:MAG: hypothetical protein AAB791_03580 [Patescibacteria group bacterium]
MSIATGICWLVLVGVLFQMDPTDSGLIGLILFYASIFLSLLGTFFLSSFLWRKLFNKFALEFRLVGASFRQSFFFACLIVGVLFLQSQHFLTWWNLLLLVVAVTIIEFFCLSLRRQN